LVSCLLPLVGSPSPLLSLPSLSLLPPASHRFELNPLQKVGRLLWKATRDLFFPSPVTKDLLDRSLLSPDLGIERQKSSQIIGRQVSWSWNQTILTEVAAKQTNPAAASRQKPDRQLSRQLSGLRAEHSPKGGQKQGSVKRAFSRTFSRDLARVLSRGNSADKIFDPSAFQLPEAREEETLTAEQEKQRRMRGSMVKGAPARQQYGERLGAQTRLWAGKIFHSKDYDSEKKTGRGAGTGREGEGAGEKDGGDDYEEAFGPREDEAEKGKAGKGSRHGNKRKQSSPAALASAPVGAAAHRHQRKSRTQVVPVEDEEFGSG
jgi:hypothetical protein